MVKGHASGEPARAARAAVATPRKRRTQTRSRNNGATTGAPSVGIPHARQREALAFPTRGPRALRARSATPAVGSLPPRRDSLLLDHARNVPPSKPPVRPLRAPVLSPDLELPPPTHLARVDLEACLLHARAL